VTKVLTVAVWLSPPFAASEAGAPGTTVRVALPAAPAKVPVTAWTPADVLEQTAPRQLPVATEKVVEAVTSPRVFSYWSRASAANVCVAPAATVAVAGVTAR
jgi:hypothetical protein